MKKDILNLKIDLIINTIKIHKRLRDEIKRPITKSDNCNILYIIICNMYIRYSVKDKKWYIRLNDLCRNLYKRYMNINIVRKNVIKLVKNDVDAFIKKFVIYKIDGAWSLIIPNNDLDIIKMCKLNYKWSENLYLDKEPSKWVIIDNKNIMLLRESYVENSIITYGKYLETNHIHDLYSNKDLIDCINSLQNIYYHIDKELFINIFTEYDINNYFKNEYSREVVDCSSIDKNDYISILSNEIMKKNINENDMSLFLRKEWVKNYINESNTSTSSFSLNEVWNILGQVLSFIYNYNSEKIYHIIYIDYRGRMYHKGILNYVSSKLIRYLVQFNTKFDENIINDYYKYYLACQINPKIISISSGIELYDSLDLQKSYNIKFDKINIYKRNTIELDATSSMMQIIGLISKNYKLMYYTNLIPNNIRIDIYDYIIICVKKESKQVYQYDMFEKTFYSNRSFIKYILMLYTYGSSALYTSKKIIKDEKSLDMIHYLSLTKIVSCIHKIFNKEFPVVKTLKNMLKKYSKLETDDKVTMHTLLKTIKYSVPKDEKIRIQINENMSTKFVIGGSKIDKSKMLKSIFVNIVHSLDSDICILTRNDLLKQNIKSLSVHDCWVININDYEKCLKSYLTSLNLILENNLDIFKIIPNILKHSNKLEKEFIQIKKLNNLYTECKNYNIKECKYALKPE